MLTSAAQAHRRPALASSDYQNYAACISNIAYAFHNGKNEIARAIFYFNDMFFHKFLVSSSIEFHISPLYDFINDIESTIPDGEEICIMALTKEEYEKLDGYLKVTRRRPPQPQDPELVERDEEGYPLFNGAKYPEEITAYLEKAEKKTITLRAEGHDFKLYIFDAEKKAADRRLFINIHGGGWVAPHMDNDDYFSAYFAQLTGGVVLDVDYTTSTKAPFNVMFAQCMEAAHYAFAHAEELGCSRNKITIGGYSAGGHLAYGTALKCREEGLPVYSLICAYTPFDMSAVDYGDPEALEGQTLRNYAFDRLLFAGEDALRNTPYGNPVSTSEELMKLLPPTMVISASHCPFCEIDEGFAARLIAAGVPVVAIRYDTNHGFIPHFMKGWHQAADAMDRFVRR